jgi:hypothetical protein
MGLHRNARLGLAGRRRLVADVEAGLSCREAGGRPGGGPPTRWSGGGATPRRLADDGL